MASCNAPAEVAWPSHDSLLVRCNDSSGQRLLVVDPNADPVESEEPWAADRAVFALAPDGSAVARFEDDEIRVFSAAGAWKPQKLVAKDAEIRAIAISSANADGAARIVVGDAEGRFGSAVIGRQKKIEWQTTAHVGPITHASVAASGSHAVTIDSGGVLIAWNPDSEPVAVERTSAPVVSWPTKSRSLAFAGPRHDVVVLSLDSGRQLGRLRGATKRIHSLDSTAPGGANSPAGWILAAAHTDGRSAPQNTRAWSLEESAAHVLRPRTLGACAINSAADRVACVVGSQLHIRPVDDWASPGGGVELPEAARGPIGGLAVTKAGASVLWKSGADRLVRAERKEDGGYKVALLDVPIADPLIVAAASQQRFAVVGGQSLAIVETGVSATADLGSAATAVTFSSDDSQLAVAAKQHPIRIYDSRTAKETSDLSDPKLRGATQLAFTYDSSKLASAKGRKVFVTTLGDGKTEAVPLADAEVTCVGWDRSGRVLVTGTALGMVHLLDLDTKRTFAIAELGSVASCQPAPANNRYLFTSNGGLVSARTFDTTPIWTAEPPEDPRFGDFQVVRWRGLVPEPKSTR